MIGTPQGQGEGSGRVRDGIRRAAGELTRGVHRRRGLRAVLAGSLLFGGVAVASVIAGSPPASAAPAVSLYVAVGGSGDCKPRVNACGSIQEAITTAQTNDGTDAVTINVGAGTYSENDTIAASSLDSLTIAGAGASTTTVDGGKKGSVFTVDSGTVTISDLTITDGLAANGGGIDNTDSTGSLTIASSTITGNTTDAGANGNGNGGSGGNGGGIDNAGTLTIDSSTIAGNTTGGGGYSVFDGSGGNGGSGGGIDNAGSLTIDSSTISGNTTGSGGGGGPGGGGGGGGNGGNGGNGGGIENSGTATIDFSTISGNTTGSGGGGNGGGYGGGGGSGGGIDNAGSLTIDSSTISGNTTGGGGLGFDNGGGNGGSGGGIDNAGSLTIDSSTISGNTTGGGGSGNGKGDSGGNGGGIANAGKLTIESSTISGNTAGSGGGIDNSGPGTASLGATIVANSTSGGDCSGTVTDLGYNLADDTSCGFTVGGTSIVNTTNLDTSLGALANNGGPTQTILPATGSPAIGVIPNPTTLGGVKVCPHTDQRGVTLGTGAKCTTGAVEVPGDLVAFNSEGGSAVGSISGPDGSSIALPSDTYPGYVFDGWYTAASGGTKVGGAGASYTVPVGGITLFAQWTENAIDTVAFNSEGGAAVASLSGPDGSSITLPSDTYPFHTLNGWYTAASGGTLAGQPGASFTVPVGGTTLYAQWTIVPPTVTTVSPNAGPTTGGTAITITGTGFTAPASVKIGQGIYPPVAATDVTVVSSTEITAVTGAAHSTGQWFLTVTTPEGTSAVTKASYFSYDPVPSVSSVSPNAGPTKVGTAITITGTGFVSGATVVIGQGTGTAGAIAATHVKVVSPTEITAVTGVGAKAGVFNLFVTTAGGTSHANYAGDEFAYGGPTVTGVSPKSGSVTGGTTITITGTGFVAGATVEIGQGTGTVGAIAATHVVVVSPTEITAVTGGGAKAGLFNLYVTTAAGTSVGSSGSGFTYN